MKTLNFLEVYGEPDVIQIFDFGIKKKEKIKRDTRKFSHRK